MPAQGIEIVASEEEVAALAPAAAQPAWERPSPSLAHGDGAGAQPPAASPSDEDEGDRNLRTRLWKAASRNAENLMGAVTGARPLPELPIQMRGFESVAEARNT